MLNKKYCRKQELGASSLSFEIIVDVAEIFFDGKVRTITLTLRHKVRPSGPVRESPQWPTTAKEQEVDGLFIEPIFTLRNGGQVLLKYIFVWPIVLFSRLAISSPSTREVAQF